MVHDLNTALRAYWATNTPREHQAAYHEVLLFGGPDGYREGWRPVLARWLRMIAAKIEG